MSLLHAAAARKPILQAVEDRDIMRRLAELRGLYFDGDDRLEVAATDIDLFIGKMLTAPVTHRDEARAFVETVEKLLAEPYVAPEKHVH